jgi:type II secretory ATPase GspE/PulE/Tfp pilus assembly ATPase PilB-like protein
MTGHLVFSTVHANDAASTLIRLKDLGVPPYLIASTVMASLSQRLVRRICPDCRRPYDPPADWIAGTPLEGVPLAHGAGCDLCMGTGYRGRLGVYEIVTVTEAIRRRFLEECSSDALHALARELGMGSMRDSAIEAVRAGHTTIEEVRRVLPPEELKP